MNTKFNLNYPAMIFSFIFALILAFLLFMPPQIGIANSGDFGRIMDIFKFYYVPDYSNFTHFYDMFTFNRPENAPHYNGYMTTTSIFIFISLLINNIINLFTDTNYYYIYSLSVVYVIGYVTGFYILISYFFRVITKKYMAYIVSILALMILSDALFVEFFNSFFQEPAYIVCVLLFIACFLRFKSFFLDAVLLTLIIFSKEQYLLYMLMLLPLFIKYKPNLNKIIIIVVLMAIPFYFYTQVNTYSKTLNAYGSIFSGLLHNTKPEDAAKVLSSIGMNPEYKEFSRMGYFATVAQLNSTRDMKSIMLFQQAVTDASLLKSLYGYVLYPSKIFLHSYDYLNEVEKSGPFPPNLGNYKPDQGSKYRVSAFTWFAKIVKNLRYVFIINILLTIILIIYKYKLTKAQSKALAVNPEAKISSKVKQAPDIKGLLLDRRSKAFLTLVATLNIIALCAIPVYIFGNGFGEAVKHIIDVYLVEGIIFILLLMEFGS